MDCRRIVGIKAEMEIDRDLSEGIYLLLVEYQKKKRKEFEELGQIEGR